MKKILYIFCLIYLQTFSSYAQDDKKQLGRDINPGLIKTSGSVTSIKLSENKHINSDLIIVDNRILGGKSGHKFKINKDSLVFVRSIIDEESVSGIKRIFIYESRRRQL